jgi:hypothetical protein
MHIHNFVPVARALYLVVLGLAGQRWPAVTLTPAPSGHHAVGSIIMHPTVRKAELLVQHGITVPLVGRSDRPRVSNLDYKCNETYIESGKK